MNIFTKLTVSILLFGITHHVFSQEMMYKTRQKVDIPFYDGDAVRSFLNKRSDFDTLWLPAYMYAIVYDTIHSGDYFYEYHENGLLKRFNFYDNFKGELLCYSSYNNTYRDPEMDILDTLFYYAYTDNTGQYHPPVRFYYNNRQADSSYWEEFYQIWDGEKWNTEERSYVHLLDTLTVSEFQDHVEIFDRNEKLKKSRKTYLTFDNNGNVIEAVSDGYNSDNGNYKVKWVYTYDTEGKCDALSYYHVTSSGTWKLDAKFTDLKWLEFHGFNNGDMMFFLQPLGTYDYSLKNKNKISHFKRLWNPCGTDIWEVDGIVDIEWKNYPFSYHYESYRSVLKEMCISYRRYLNLNEQYHYNSRGSSQYEFWKCDTIPDSWIKDFFINKYDDRGRRYEYTWNNTWFPPLFDSISQMIMTYKVDSFTYVLRPVNDIFELPADKHTLLIVPNPSGETVRIEAEDEIATVSFYASDGRLAYSRDGAGKEMTVNIQGLAKGVYVVQARLKNGGVQTGKVVVRNN